MISSALAVFAALLVSIFPGALFVTRREREREDFVDRLGIAVATSWAFWAALLWIVPAGLWTEAVLAVVTAAALLEAARHRSSRAALPPHTPPVPRTPALLLFVLLLSIAFRVATAFHRPPPSTGDLTMHATMTELIRLADGLPSSHEPLLPIASFGQNSPGLHGMAALVARASGVPADRAILLLGTLALVVLALSLDRVLRALLPGVSRTARGLAAFGTLLVARSPQLFLGWGGLPTIASIALVFFVFAEALEGVGAFDPRRALRAGLVMAGAVLTHLLPVVAALYVAAPILLVLAMRRRSPAAFAHGALAVAFALALVARFIERTRLTPTSSTVEWAQGWIRGELSQAALPQRLALGRFGFSAETSAWLALPFYWLVCVGLLAATVLVGWTLLRLRHPSPPFGIVVAVFALLVLLHCAALGEFLPYWMALYPSRVHLFLLVPVGIAAAELFAWCETRPWRRRGAAIALAGIALVTTMSVRRAGPDGDKDLGGLGLDAAARTLIDTMNARVGADDLTAFEWIREHTPSDAVIANNEADCGQLLSARVHRKITFPHYQHFWYEDEFEAWSATHPPGWVFVGARPSPVYPREWTAESLDRDAAWSLAFRSGDARVYRSVVKEDSS